MSGGSMDYLCYRVEEAADILCIDSNPSRKAFGKHLRKVAHALHEIEWVDSGDSSSPDDINAIRDVFGDTYRQIEMEALISDAKALIEKMQELGA